MDTPSTPRHLVLQTFSDPVHCEIVSKSLFEARAFHSLHILSNPGSRKGIGAGGIFIIGCRSHIKGDVESAALFSQHSTRTNILLGTRENHLLKFWTNMAHVVIILNKKKTVWLKLKTRTDHFVKVADVDAKPSPLGLLPGLHFHQVVSQVHLERVRTAQVHLRKSKNCIGAQLHRCT